MIAVLTDSVFGLLSSYGRIDDFPYIHCYMIVILNNKYFLDGLIGSSERVDVHREFIPYRARYYSCFLRCENK